jgi:hypothetical protein
MLYPFPAALQLLSSTAPTFILRSFLLGCCRLFSLSWGYKSGTSIASRKSHRWFLNFCNSKNIFVSKSWASAHVEINRALSLHLICLNQVKFTAFLRGTSRMMAMNEKSRLLTWSSSMPLYFSFPSCWALYFLRTMVSHKYYSTLHQISWPGWV